MSDNERRVQLEAAGHWLRTERIRHGFRTLGEFARVLDVDPSRISNYERGMSAVPDDRAEQIADVLHMDIVEVRRNLGLWVPNDHGPRDEDYPEDPLVRIVSGDMSQLTYEQLVHYNAVLARRSAELAEQMEQAQREHVRDE